MAGGAFHAEPYLKLFSYAQVLLDLAIVGIIVLRPGIAFQSGDTYSHALRGV